MADRLENPGCGSTALAERTKDLTTRELRYLVAQLAQRYWDWDSTHFDDAVRKAKQCSAWEKADAAFERAQEAGARHAWIESERHYCAYERHFWLAEDPYR
jgi:hypothetical protein